MKQRKNIAKVLRRADPIDVDEGLLAFPRYQEMMRRLADHYSFSIEHVTACFVALSPNNDYLKNLRSTVTLLKGFKEGVEVESLTVSTYNACKYRAWRFLHGDDFLSVTKGPKTRAFYQNILDPYNPHPVTIDGHMVSVWTGKRMTMKQVATQGFNYEIVATDFRAVAYDARLLPNQLQAIVWFTWKRINRIVYDGQFRLFDREDCWRLIRQPDEIIPFPVGALSVHAQRSLAKGRCRCGGRAITSEGLCKECLFIRERMQMELKWKRKYDGRSVRAA
jgi:hypothetical protein